MAILAVIRNNHSQVLFIVFGLADDVRLGCYLGRRVERLCVIFIDLLHEGQLGLLLLLNLLLVGELAYVVERPEVFRLFLALALDRAVLLHLDVADGFDGDADDLGIEGG